MLELFRNAAKIKQLYEEGHYLKATVLLLKTLAAMGAEFEEDGGEVTIKAKKVKAADRKQLEKAEETLAGLQQSIESTPRVAGGGRWLELFIQLLPALIDIIRNRKGDGLQPA